MVHGCEAHLDPIVVKDPRKLGPRSKSGTDLSTAFDGPGTDLVAVKAAPDTGGDTSSSGSACAHAHHVAPLVASEDDDDQTTKRADVAGALASVSSTKSDDQKKSAPLDMPPNKLRHKINSANVTLEKHLTITKDDEAQHPLIHAAKQHLKEAKTRVDHIVKGEIELKKKHHEEKSTAVDSKKASKEAQVAATKLETTKTMAKMGKATTKDVDAAQKLFDHKKKAASEKAAKHIKASTDKKNAETKLEHTKKTTAAHIDAALKTTTVAAKTSSKAADATSSAAQTVKHHIGDVATHTVKTDCSFLDVVVLGELKKMPEVDSEFSCVGLGTYHDEGHAKLGAIRCKPTPLGACPTEFNADVCHIVPLSVGSVHFKPLFDKE